MIRRASLLAACAAVASLSAAELRAVPTFECCSLYLDGSDLAAGQARVRYRPAGGTWQEAHPLTASANDPAPRGSLFGLRPGTAYEAECAGPDGRVVASAAFTTWSDDVPVARTVRIADLAPAGGAVVIDQGGSGEGWVRYVGDGRIIDGGEAAAEAVLVTAHHVLLDGLVVRGGRRHGIRVAATDSVRIRNADIAGWGRTGPQDPAKGVFLDASGAAINYDAGVCVDGAADLVVERSWIHDPRGRANSWFYAHPAGPCAMYVHARGGLVVRWNDCIGSDEHRWNDVIEGWGNGKPDGGFCRDADVYGNILAFGNDDGIEIDGPQCNVRVWGNLITGTHSGVSTAPNLRGPSWIIANAIADLGDERGVVGAAVKNGGGTSLSRGTSFLYHNTVVTTGNGIAAIGYGEDRDRAMFRGVSRNNILAVSGQGILDSFAPPGADFDHDLFATPWGGAGSWQTARPMEAHGLAAGHGLNDPASGDFRSAAGSPVRGGGTPLPGFAHLQPDGRADLGIPGGRPVPWRPLAMTARPARVRFAGACADELATAATVLVDPGAITAPVPFTIRRNAACDWIAVEPASGTLEPGRTLSLSVRLLPGVMSRDGHAVGAFMLVLPDGQSLPVPVAAEVSTVELRQLAEAEALPGAADFAVREDAGASGGRYLAFAAERERTLGARGVELAFTVPAEGRYALWLRLRCPAPAGDHDSLFTGLDGAALAQGGLDGLPEWHWVPLSGPLGCWAHLAAGEHRLRLQPREVIDLDAVQVRSTPLPPAERGR